MWDQTLYLSRNELVSIPEKLEKLKNLEKLSISDNISLKQWPKGLENLKNLKKLWIDQKPLWTQYIENLKKINKNLEIHISPMK